MVSGSVNNESLREVLRSLSIKRRNGVLGVFYDGVQLELSFQEGKIVKVNRDDESEAVQVCSRLVTAGCVIEKVVKLVSESGISVSQLYDLLISKNYVSHDEFVRAKRGYEYDLLHSLGEFDQGKAHFTPKVLRSDPRQSLAVFPGQLVLDLTELAGDEERFNSLFGGLESTVRTIKRSAATSDDSELHEQRSLAEAERILFDLAYEGCSPGEMLERSLLSRYDIMQGLLALYDQKLIRVEAKSDGDIAAVAAEDPAPAPLVAAVAQVLSEHKEPITKVQPSIPQSKIGDLVDQAVHHLQAMTPEPMADESGVLSIDSLQLPLVDGDKSTLRAPFSSAHAGHNAPKGPVPLTRRTPVAQEQVTPDEDLADEEGSQTDAAHDSLRMSHSGLKAQLKSFNYYMLDPSVAKPLVLVATLAYLFFVATIGSKQFEAWFKALGIFSSN